MTDPKPTPRIEPNPVHCATIICDDDDEWGSTSFYTTRPTSIRLHSELSAVLGCGAPTDIELVHQAAAFGVTTAAYLAGLRWLRDRMTPKPEAQDTYPTFGSLAHAEEHPAVPEAAKDFPQEDSGIIPTEGKVWIGTEADFQPEKGGETSCSDTQEDAPAQTASTSIQSPSNAAAQSDPAPAASESPTPWEEAAEAFRFWRRHSWDKTSKADDKLIDLVRNACERHAAAATKERDQLDARCNALYNQTVALSRIADRAEQERDSIRAQLADAKAVTKELERSNIAYRDDADSARARLLQNKSPDLQAVLKHRDELENQLAGAKADVSHLVSRNALIARARLQAEQLVFEKEAELAALKSENETLQAAFATADKLALEQRALSVPREVVEQAITLLRTHHGASAYAILIEALQPISNDSGGATVAASDVTNDPLHEPSAPPSVTYRELGPDEKPIKGDIEMSDGRPDFARTRDCDITVAELREQYPNYRNLRYRRPIKREEKEEPSGQKMVSEFVRSELGMAEAPSRLPSDHEMTVQASDYCRLNIHAAEVYYMLGCRWMREKAQAVVAERERFFYDLLEAANTSLEFRMANLSKINADHFAQIREMDEKLLAHIDALRLCETAFNRIIVIPAKHEVNSAMEAVRKILHP